MFYGGLAYQDAEKLNDPNLQINALIPLLKAGIKMGNYSVAIKLCLKADSIATANSLKTRKIETLMYKGLVYSNSGLDAEGLRIYFEAKDLIIETSDRSFESELDYYIALAYFNINEINLCRTYLMKAYINEFSKNDSANAFKSLLLMSSTFYQSDSVLKYLQLAEKSLSTDSSNYKKSVLLNNKALFFRSFGEISKAKKCYLEAIAISSYNRFDKQIANLYNNFAYLLMSEQKFDSAFLVLQKALVISKNLNNIDIEASVLDSYSDCYMAVGDSAGALLSYKQSVKLRNEFRNNQQIEKSLMLSTVFETEKKEREIAHKNTQLYRTNMFLLVAILLFIVAMVLFILFRQKSAMRKVRISAMDQEKKLEVANALIEGQDSERKNLAMNLHDGIAPKMGSLQLMVDNHFEHAEGYHKVCTTIKDIDTNIREISHRMLPSQLESRGLVVALKQFIHSLQQNNAVNISYYFTLNRRLDDQYESNIFYVFYELLHNALKHAAATEITVQLLDDGEVLSCSVEDNGKGFDPKNDYRGIGLKNIYQRVKYLNGDINIDSDIGQGTAVLIEINIKKK
jgi:signal transduction histidine kinase